MSERLHAERRAEHSRKITAITWALNLSIFLLSISVAAGFGALAGMIAAFASAIVCLCCAQVVEAIREARYL
jgi:hypothetical protein